MTPLEFIASLPHGEAKAAALTVYNLMKDECDRIDIALIRANSLISHISWLTDEPIRVGLKKEEEEDASVSAKTERNLLNTSISDLKFSNRTENLLRSNGIQTVKQLVSQSEGSLVTLRELGEKTLNVIKYTLRSHGLKLKDHQRYLEEADNIE